MDGNEGLVREMGESGVGLACLLEGLGSERVGWMREFVLGII